MITIKHRGSFKYTEKFFAGAQRINSLPVMQRYAEEGVRALASATPKDTGITADSWGYEIKKSRSGYRIVWTNSNINEGVPIVILLQYGHGTQSGAYIEGRDFINPAIRPIFEKIASSMWEEVTKL